MDYKMISADDHLDLQYLPPDLWTQRLPKALRHRAPHVEECDGGSGPAHADRLVRKRILMRSIGAVWTIPSVDRRMQPSASRTWTRMAWRRKSCSGLWRLWQSPIRDCAWPASRHTTTG